MAAKDELELRGMLLATGLVQPVRGDSRGGKVSVLCRMVPGQESTWLKAVEALLQKAEGAVFSVHLCKQFVLKNGSMVAGWHVSIDAKGAQHLPGAIDALRPVLTQFQPDLVLEDRVEIVLPPTKVAAPPPEDDEEAKEFQPQTPDLVERRKAYKQKTTAHPRPPAPAPAALDFEKEFLDAYKPRIVASGSSPEGTYMVEEMRLPGVRGSDMNVPNEKGRGATGTRT